MYISSLMEAYRSDLTQFFRFISVNDETGKSRDPGHFFREINPGKMTRDHGKTGSRERNPTPDLWSI